MSDNSILTYAPIVGNENIVTVIDEDDSVRKPFITGSVGSGFVPLNSFGDGAPPSDPSEIVTDPAGRAGSLRTILHILFNAETDIDGVTLDLFVNIPYNMKGLARTGLSLAQLNDPANFPNLDPSRFLPKVTAYPQISPWSSAADIGPSQGFDPVLLISGTTAAWPAGIERTCGSSIYVAPQAADGAFPAGGGAVDPSIEAYGMLGINVTFAAPLVLNPDYSTTATAAVVPAGAVLAIDIDFSASIAS